MLLLQLNFTLFAFYIYIIYIIVIRLPATLGNNTWVIHRLDIGLDMHSLPKSDNEQKNSTRSMHNHSCELSNSSQIVDPLEISSNVFYIST